MPSYRFCRTDDMALLVDALNRCGNEPSMTPTLFKRSIRDLQVWCSSCMVAFAGADPIGVLIGAKRPSGTLVHRIAVHPDHRRQGHGRHLLASLGSKLAILGPPRIAAEVPETLDPACALFTAGGYVQEALLTDYVWQPAAGPDPSARSGSSRAGSRDARASQGDASRRGFVIPVTMDDLAANDLLGELPSRTCWERSVETLMARKHDLTGVAVASDERIEAFLLYTSDDVSQETDRGAGPRAVEPRVEILALRSLVEDDGARLRQLVARLPAQRVGSVRFPKVGPAEIPATSLEMLGFRPAGSHRLYAATLQHGSGSP